MSSSSSSSSSPSPSPASFRVPNEDLGVTWAMRWHLLVNAPSGAIAGDITTLITTHPGLHPAPLNSGPPPALRASALPGCHPKLITAQDQSALFDEKRSPSAEPGDELAGLGTYLVEIAQINDKVFTAGISVGRRRVKVIGVQRTDPTLDVDLWSPSCAMSESELRQAIGSLVQQRELDLSLPAGPLLKRPAL